MKRSALAVAVLAVTFLLSPPAHATARNYSLASQYGPPGDPPSGTATGHLCTAASRWFASRDLPFHTVVMFWWHGAKAAFPCMDRGPAAWTGCHFDMTSGAVRLLEWRANFRAIYRGWYWHHGANGAHKWRRLVGWRRIHRYAWSGRQGIYWLRLPAAP